MNIDQINLLRQNARSVVRELGLLNDAYFDIGVTLAERHLLIELNACIYPTIGDIAERLLLDKSTASRLITKAVKKGYVKSTSDQNDKRKRYLQLTEKGKEVLNEFEPIAFAQTRDALFTLTSEEREIVYRGIELYAKGLRNSRMKDKAIISRISREDNPAIAHLLMESRDIYEVYGEKGWCYFVVTLGSKIVGGVGIAPSVEVGCCEVRDVYLPQDAAGLELALIDACIKEAQRLEYVKFINTEGDILWKA